MDVVVIRSGRHPLAILLLALFMVSGIAGLISPAAAAPTLIHAISAWELRAWFAGLLASSATALVAVLGRGFLSLAIERVAMIMLAALSAFYVIAVILQAGVVFAPPLTGIAALSGSAVWRAVQISSDLKRAANRGGDRP